MNEPVDLSNDWIENHPAWTIWHESYRELAPPGGLGELLVSSARKWRRRQLLSRAGCSAALLLAAAAGLWLLRADTPPTTAADLSSHEIQSEWDEAELRVKAIELQLQRLKLAELENTLARYREKPLTAWDASDALPIDERLAAIHTLVADVKLANGVNPEQVAEDYRLVANRYSASSWAQTARQRLEELKPDG